MIPSFQEKVASEAQSWVGTPYRHQASVKGQGADCLGLLRGVWRAIIGQEPELLPPYSPDWMVRDRSCLLRAAESYLLPVVRQSPQKGDVMLFRMVKGGAVKHCAIALGPEKFVHAYDSKGVVANRYGQWWAERCAGVFVFPETVGEIS